MVPSAIVKRMVEETVEKMLLATTVTKNVPACDGVPEITPELSQRRPGGNPDAENPVGLLFAVTW
jgi:hypothetical protein